LCGNSTDGSSPLIFQVNFLSAIRVNKNIDILLMVLDTFIEPDFFNFPR